MDFGKLLSDVGAWVVTYGPWIVTASAAAAATLPAPQEGTVWAKVRRLLDWAALNVGNAKNLPKA